MTPIQLSIDRLREKYSSKINEESKDFEKLLANYKQANKKDIESLVNEFSNFARMPRPVMKKISINQVIKRAIDLSKLSSKNEIKFKNVSYNINISGDEEQLNRKSLLTY